MTMQSIATDTSTNGYASVNGLEMYYEIHGAGRPLVLLHGAMCTIETDFATVLPIFASSRKVIAIEQQAHGRTADIDRPLSYEQMAEDTASLLRQLEIQHADFFGHSLGGGIALQIALRHPELVRKWVWAGAPSYSVDGFYPELRDNFDQLTPEMLAGTPWAQAYARTAPKPEAWPTLVGKVRDMDMKETGWPAEAVRSIAAPALLVLGDSDIIRPEHTVEMFRLLGGGVAGDLVGLPKSQLAVLPGTTHIAVVERSDWLVSMISGFLDAPLTDAPRP
jgi:pimeloyl-ACP methyl ester carboxylesterase